MILKSAFCPHCDFKPNPQSQPSGADQLAELSDRLETLYHEWTQILLTELKTIQASEQWELLQTENKLKIAPYLKNFYRTVV